MRWSCPHCGVNLSVADDKIGSGWSFSRCYKCAGYGLIRKSELNLIKVHGAPAGEKVLATEGHEQQFLSQTAIQNYNRLVSNSNQIQQQAPAPQPQVQPQAHQGIPAEYFQLPEPLPEPTSTRKGFHVTLPKISMNLNGKLLPIAIAAAGITAVCSGVYFYVQGQALLSRARMQTHQASQALDAKAQAIQAAAAQIPAKPQQIQQIQQSATRINDQVRDRMMAPVRQPMPSAAKMEEPEEYEEEMEELTAVTPQISSMMVRVPIDKAKIRSGPGLDYPVIAYAKPDQRYLITSWNERWFKIKVQTAAATVAGARNEGWIRNDLVQLLNQ
jgi:hypothetical protein